MIKTFTHDMIDIDKRDKEINLFSIDNEVFATQTNIAGTKILTTIFFKTRSR
jgi:hypothetical protein